MTSSVRVESDHILGFLGSVLPIVPSVWKTEWKTSLPRDVGGSMACHVPLIFKSLLVASIALPVTLTTQDVLTGNETRQLFSVSSTNTFPSRSESSRCITSELILTKQWHSLTVSSSPRTSSSVWNLTRTHTKRMTKDVKKHGCATCLQN